VATQRFTGPQIRRFAKLEPAAWAKTKRVHLVSSFFASVLAGKDAAIDTGDGAGMNLMDIRKGDWAPAALAATAPDLAAKLPPVRPGSTVAGGISAYFVARYGFSARAIILPASSAWALRSPARSSSASAPATHSSPRLKASAPTPPASATLSVIRWAAA
jgi:sugar (pentulose or hexulose) kinase